MLHAVPFRESRLNHRAFHLALATRGELIVAATSQGCGTLIASPHFEQSPLRLPSLRHLAISPDGTQLLLITEAGLELYATHKVGLQFAVAGVFTAGEFSADGQSVYTTERSDGETIRISVRDAATLTPAHLAEIEDPFGESDCSIIRHPVGPYFAVWIAAGQDGQAVVSVSLNEVGLLVAPLADLFDVSPPVFSQDGASVLIITESSELRRYSFPSGELVSTFTWPERDDELDTHAAFAGDDAALVLSNYGRLYLVDLVRGALLTEVAVPGHLPRPLSELYPPLTDPVLASDAHYLGKCGVGMFMSTHKDLPADNTEWHDSVAIWTLPTLPPAA